VPIPIEWLVGPVAALALALVVIGALYRLLRDYITDLKTERDGWKARSVASDARLEKLANELAAALKKAKVQ
jgi:hypothetical protein